jgi:hypothetical protein
MKKKADDAQESRCTGPLSQTTCNYDFKAHLSQGWQQTTIHPACNIFNVTPFLTSYIETPKYFGSVYL